MGSWAAQTALLYSIVNEIREVAKKNYPPLPRANWPSFLVKNKIQPKSSLPLHAPLLVAGPLKEIIFFLLLYKFKRGFVIRIVVDGYTRKIQIIIDDTFL